MESLFSCIAMGEVVDVLSTKAGVKQSSASIMQCVDCFEGGAQNVYFLDDANRYIFKALQKKDCNLSNEAVKAGLPLSSAPPIVFFLPISAENGKQLQMVIEAGFAQSPGISELPIVGSDGHIVAVARHKELVRPSLDWKKVANAQYKLPQAKLYISSVENAELKALFETFKNFSDIELMTASNAGMIMSGKADGILIYGTDIYPDIRKISVEELYSRLTVSNAVFDKNLEALNSCAGFHMDFYKRATTEGKQPQAESRVKSFLAQVESKLPIILEDAYDIEEITWMCDRLRVSDRFGSDNKLYLQYSSWSDFLKSMEVLDWTYIARSGKVIFLFGDEQKQKYYPTSAEPGTPQPLQIDEIIELVNSFPRSHSGSDFFNMILDSHPSLLTIGWHGLSSFTMLWKVFCKDKTAKEAVEHLRKPNGDAEVRLRDTNLAHMFKRKKDNKILPIKIEDYLFMYMDCLSPFLEGLSLYLNPEKKYGLHDWFKAFYLSNNVIVFGRKFLQRITPAIFYDMHGMNQSREKIDFNITSEEVTAMRKEVRNGFKYKRYVGVVRHPLGRLGSVVNTSVRFPSFYPNSPFRALMIYGEASPCRYMSENNPAFPASRHVRFEDLKLYPRETTEKLCEFLRIPWSETCLHITTNGEDSGIVDGTAGFDTRPVYNPHLEYMSTFDYYRIELLNGKNFETWGYKLKYYDETKYTAEDLKKMFAIPFKFETQALWPNQKESKKLHEWILQRALEVMEHGEKDYSIDKDGKPLRLVEVLVPDLAPGQKLFEC